MKEEYRLTRIAIVCSLMTMLLAFLSGDLLFVIGQFIWCGVILMAVFTIESMLKK